MARHLAFANLAYLALAIQPMLISQMPDASYRPWLPAIVLIICVVNGNDLSAIICAFALGLCVDCVSLHRPGVHTMITTSLAVALRLVLHVDDARGIVLYGALTFFVTFVWLISSTVINGLLEEQTFDLADYAMTTTSMSASTTMIVVTVMALNAALQYLLRSRDRSPVVLGNRWTMLTGK